MQCPFDPKENEKIVVQIPTRIPEKIVVGPFSGILVNSGILVVAGRLQSTSK